MNVPLFLLAAFAAANAFAVRCDDLVAIVGKSEQELLAAFDPTKIVPTSIVPLEAGVFRVSARNGDGQSVDYVVRVGVDRTDVPFEQLAIRFASEAPKVAHTGSRELKPNERDGVEKTLKGHGKWPQKDGRPVAASKMSVAVFYPDTIRGEEYLAKVGLTSPVVAELLAFSRSERTAQDLSQLETDLRRILKEGTTRGERELLMEDLKARFAECKDLSHGNLLEQLMDLAKKQTPAAFEKLAQRALDRIPGAIRTQIADLWAVRYVIGDHDFHTLNWLLKKDVVIGIDFASSWGIDVGGGPENARLPINGNVHALDHTMLMSWMSPEVKSYLAALKREDVERIARESNYVLSPERLDKVLERAKQFR